MVAPQREALAEAPARFGLDDLAGRLIELQGGADGALLTCAFGLLLEAQRRGEPAAYVGSSTSSFYPPDVAEGGVDLDALPVVLLADPAARARAADELARSGAFALLVVDLGTDDGAPPRIPPALVARLLGLAQKHATAVLFLSPGDENTPSPLGSLVSLRAVVRRRPLDLPRNRCAVSIEVVKDKRRAPGWGQEEICRAPSGIQ